MDYSRKFGEISFLIALFALIISQLDNLISLLYPDFYSKNRLISYIFMIIFFVVLVNLIYLIIIIARKKIPLNEIIIRIEEDRLKIQNDVDKSIRSEIKIPERDLKTKANNESQRTQSSMKKLFANFASGSFMNKGFIADYAAKKSAFICVYLRLKKLIFRQLALHNLGGGLL